MSYLACFDRFSQPLGFETWRYGTQDADCAGATRQGASKQGLNCKVLGSGASKCIQMSAVVTRMASLVAIAMPLLRSYSAFGAGCEDQS